MCRNVSLEGEELARALRIGALAHELAQLCVIGEPHPVGLRRRRPVTCLWGKQFQQAFVALRQLAAVRHHQRHDAPVCALLGAGRASLLASVYTGAGAARVAVGQGSWRSLSLWRSSSQRSVREFSL